MKLILSFILLLSFVCHSFAAPLIYKNTLIISEYSEKPTQFIEIETGKFKRIKIDLQTETSEYNLRELSNYLSGVKSGMFGVIIEAVEGDEIYQIESRDVQTFKNIIEMPPSKIRISVKGRGKYKLYIYGE